MKYRVIISENAQRSFVMHFTFLSKVSLPAAKRLRQEYINIIERLKENPYQFPIIEENLTLPRKYRKALFTKRYQLIFCISDKTVFIDMVIDCRQSQ